jgi:hypothetical protein
LSSTSAGESASIVLGSTSTSAVQSSSLQYPLAAPWLANVQRRLNNSVGLDLAAPDGQWLTKGVVSAANTFFQATSDLLPIEPFLYSSTQGDLVAEFQGVEIPITVIFSTSNAIALAVIAGQPLKFTIPLAATPAGALRSELTKITEILRAKRHEPVDAER